MSLDLKLGQIFWLVIPHFKEKLKPRPFLVRGITENDYIFLCITSKDRREKVDYIPQYLLTYYPSSLYKPKPFADLNILVYIKHNLFTELLNKRLGLERQDQSISLTDFKKITERVNDCFNNQKFRGNRYKIRVI